MWGCDEEGPWSVGSLVKVIGGAESLVVIRTSPRRRVVPTHESVWDTLVRLLYLFIENED